MIEFKAVCGHTVRARDEDAGNVVPCAYCGREVEVPHKDNDELDFLFRDVEQPEVTKRRRRRRRKPKPVSLKDGKPTTFDPFAIVLKLCYVVVLLVVGIYVSYQWILPMLEQGIARQRQRSAVTGSAPNEGGDTTTPDRAGPRVDRPGTDRRGHGTPGLIGLAGKAGLYVASTPPGATVYCVEQSKAPSEGRIHQIPRVRQFAANGPSPRMPDGTYVVEVVFPWNAESLSSERLPHYEQYLAFRRRVEEVTLEKRAKLMRDYFLPDDATDVFIAETDDQLYLVRQYRDVTVRKGLSSSVRALFLPKIISSNGYSYDLKPLLDGYLPDVTQYTFNESHVRSELSYYGVAKEDVNLILEALWRIGTIPYVTSDRRIRLFKIGVHDGEFKMRVIENQ